MGRVAAAANEEAPVEVHHRPIEIHRDKSHDVISRKVESTVKELVASEIPTRVEEAVNGALHKMFFYKAQSRVQLVAYNVLEQVMLDLLCTGPHCGDFRCTQRKVHRY